MRAMTPIEFGVNLHGVDPPGDLRRLVSRAAGLGYDVIAAPDHLGSPAPFAALTAAALIDDRVRVRTYVLNVGFWNPALLAREVATLDLLSDGRAELGLGAGHMRHEHEDARLPWHPLARRYEILEATLLEVRERLADEAHRPRPVQRPVPVMIGAMSHRGLALAARHADVVGFAGLRQVPDAPTGTFTLCSSGETAERVGEVQELAAGRPYRSDVLLQAVALGRDPEESAAAIAADAAHLTAAQLLDSPFVLLAPDAKAAAAELRRRREVYGFDCVTTHAPHVEALGEVIAADRSHEDG